MDDLQANIQRIRERIPETVPLLAVTKTVPPERVDAAWQYADSPIDDLRDLIRFDWDAMDAWFEEDEEVYTHPRSPYARIDVLETSRHVRVEIEGVCHW